MIESLLGCVVENADHSFCQWLIGGMAFAIVGLVSAIIKLAKMYRAELMRRVEHAEKLNGILEGLYDTRQNP